MSEGCWGGKEEGGGVHFKMFTVKMNHMGVSSLRSMVTLRLGHKETKFEASLQAQELCCRESCWPSKGTFLTLDARKPAVGSPEMQETCHPDRVTVPRGEE